MNARRLIVVVSLLMFGCLAGAPAARAADVDAVADRTLAGDAVCTRCHDQSDNKPVLSIYRTRHGVKADARTPGCQSCHGASKAHVVNAQDTDPRPAVDVTFAPGSEAESQVGTCLACHKNGQRDHWKGSQHESAGVPCSACHSVHVPKDRVLTRGEQSEVCFACHKTERAQIHRLSTHPIAAGKIDCSNCHNPHGSTGPTLMRKGSVNETCFSCHAEKRGPYLWEHEPVTEACTNCHTPHGSNISPLLKARTPWLCQSCHTGDHAAQVNSGANLQRGGVTTANGAFPLANAAARAQMVGRDCQSCHMQTHGSNHPAGSKLLR
jgi:DmsE family decaheme c-type cytochrome